MKRRLNLRGALQKKGTLAKRTVPTTTPKTSPTPDIKTTTRRLESIDADEGEKGIFCHFGPYRICYRLLKNKRKEEEEKKKKINVIEHLRLTSIRMI